MFFKYVQKGSSGISFIAAIKDSPGDPFWTYIILKLIIHNLQSSTLNIYVFINYNIS